MHLLFVGWLTICTPLETKKINKCCLDARQKFDESALSRLAAGDTASSPYGEDSNCYMVKAGWHQKGLTCREERLRQEDTTTAQATGDRDEAPRVGSMLFKNRGHGARSVGLHGNRQ